MIYEYRYYKSTIWQLHKDSVTVAKVANVMWRLERHISLGLFPLNDYLQVPRYPTNCPIGYLGNKLPGYGSPTCD